MSTTTEQPILHSQSYQERTYQDLDSVYSALQPSLQKLELLRQERLKVKKSHIPVGIGFIVFGTAFMIFSPYAKQLGISAIFIGLLLIFRTNDAAYQADYKEIVITTLTSLIDPQLKYSHKDGIPQSYFDNSKLIKARITRYRSEDLISGKFEGIDVAFSEVHAIHETRTKGTPVKMFGGVMFVADFHKHTTAQTYLFKNNGSFLSKEIDLRAPKGTKRVHIEDNSFSKLFEVFTTNHVEANYILTPAVMKRLVGLQHRIHKDIKIAFKDGCLIMLIPRASFLEPKFSKNATCEVQVQILLEEIMTFLTIVKEINLENRIWSKA